MQKYLNNRSTQPTPPLKHIYTSQTPFAERGKASKVSDNARGDRRKGGNMQGDAKNSEGAPQQTSNIIITQTLRVDYCPDSNTAAHKNKTPLSKRMPIGNCTYVTSHNSVGTAKPINKITQNSNHVLRVRRGYCRPRAKRGPATTKQEGCFLETTATT